MQQLTALVVPLLILFLHVDHEILATTSEINPNEPYSTIRHLEGHTNIHDGIIPRPQRALFDWTTPQNINLSNETFSNNIKPRKRNQKRKRKNRKLQAIKNGDKLERKREKKRKNKGERKKNKKKKNKKAKKVVQNETSFYNNTGVVKFTDELKINTVLPKLYPERNTRKEEFKKSDVSQAIVVDRRINEPGLTADPYWTNNEKRDKNEFSSAESKLLSILDVVKEEERKMKERMKYKYQNCDCEHICDKDTNKCDCFMGFQLQVDGKTCRDINECLINNGGCDHSCENVAGSYRCSCKRGWRLGSWRPGSCVDINECLLNNGHGPCSHVCENAPGSYRCSCEGLKGARLSPDGRRCVLGGPDNPPNCSMAGCSHSCLLVRAQTALFCTCPEGLQLGEDWKTCQDINECIYPEVAAKCPLGCENTFGSFRCVTPTPEPEQFNLLQSEATTELFDLSDVQIPDDVVCPPLFPPIHGYIECFRGRAAHVSSTAPSGRKRITNRPGSVCELFCPAGYKKSGKWKKICGRNGKWEGDDFGKCVQYPKPTIKCPGAIVHRLKPGEIATRVFITPPTSSLEPRYIKSEPHLKNSTILLPRGQHWVHFTATHPVTNLNAKCTVYVVVKRAPSP